MYQTIVLGLGSLLLFGGGYLIKHADDQGVLRSTLSSTLPISATTSVEVYSGVYICDDTTKCINPRILSLSSDGSATMNASYENGAEVVHETGNWVSNGDNSLTISLLGTQQGEYVSPRTLFIKYASHTVLAGASFDEKLFTDLKKPVFYRQESVIEEAQ